MLHAVVLDNVVQIGSDFQAEIPDCMSGIILLFLLLPGAIYPLSGFIYCAII